MKTQLKLLAIFHLLSSTCLSTHAQGSLTPPGAPAPTMKSLAQPPRFGPRMIEEQWAGLLTAKKLFPIRASLRYDHGAERFRFEVQSITPQKLTKEDMKLLQPPDGYFEIEPLPF